MRDDLTRAKSRGRMTADVALLIGAVLSLSAAAQSVAFEDPAVSGSLTEDGGYEYIVSVSLIGSEGPVAAHLLLPGEEQVSVPLIRGDGSSWSGSLDQRKADWTVVFEDLATGHQSPPFTMTDLGLTLTSTTLGGNAAVDGARTDSLFPVVSAVLAGAVILVGIVRFIRPVRPRHLRSRRHVKQPASHPDDQSKNGGALSERASGP